MAGERITSSSAEQSAAPVCEKCDDEGYLERWNDDQSGVVIELCPCQMIGDPNFDPPGGFDD